MKNSRNKIIDKAKIIISIIIGLALLFAGFIFVNRVFDYGNFTDTFSDLYYGDEDDYDVLFFGTSHVYKTISPMQLWNDYGITTYDVALPGCPLPVTYSILKNTIKHKKPKIAMLEVFQNEIPGNNPPRLQWMHRFFDLMPLSIEKYKDVKAYSEDKDAISEHMLPFSSYHNRWTYIKANMIKNGFGIDTDEESFVPLTKRAELDFISVYTPKYANSEVVSYEYDTEHLKDKNAEYIKKFVELCLENDIIPIVFLAPFDASEDMQRWTNAYLKAGEEAGAKTLNLIAESVTNPYTDYQDNNHLNLSGGRKVTEYLGKYLTENYQLEDKRNNPDFASWNDDYDHFRGGMSIKR